MSSVVIGFGKYRGQTVTAIAKKDPGYLAWALTINIDEELRAAVVAAVASATAALPDIASMVQDEIYPIDLMHIVRGGGRMTDGVSDVYRLVKGDSPVNPRRSYLYKEEFLSGSGKSGRVEWMLDADDVQVLRIVKTSGSIVNQKREVAYLKVVKNGAGHDWFYINGGKLAAYAVVHSLV